MDCLGIGPSVCRIICLCSLFPSLSLSLSLSFSCALCKKIPPICPQRHIDNIFVPMLICSVAALVLFQLRMQTMAPFLASCPKNAPKRHNQAKFGQFGMFGGCGLPIFQQFCAILEKFCGGRRHTSFLSRKIHALASKCSKKEDFGRKPYVNISGFLRQLCRRFSKVKIHLPMEIAFVAERRFLCPFVDGGQVRDVRNNCCVCEP